MNGSNIAIDKLKRIQELWVELGRTRSHTPEYENSMKRIRVLSAEYQAVVDGSKKPENSERVTSSILNGHPD